jgi:hypothetical protein
MLIASQTVKSHLSGRKKITRSSPDDAVRLWPKLIACAGKEVQSSDFQRRGGDFWSEILG